MASRIFVMYKHCIASHRRISRLGRGLFEDHELLCIAVKSLTNAVNYVRSTKGERQRPILLPLRCVYERGAPTTDGGGLMTMIDLEGDCFLMTLRC